ncbi:hypothetical protein P5V15_000891 [Pogonomyrmex californicus]
MTSTDKSFSKSLSMSADKCNQEVETNHFLSSQCDKKTIDSKSTRTSKIFATTVEMYLRIKPTPSMLQQNYFILNPRTLLTFENKFIRNLKCTKSSEAEGRRHAFTKIFRSKTSQEEMFEGSIKHRVVEFLGGKSSTIMTYGMRDSGKTYTLFGTPASPGIITRSIELVFSAINCTIAPWYKPFRDTMLCLSETARAFEMQQKTRVLNGRSLDTKQIFTEAKQYLKNLWPENANPDEYEECYSESMYALWLSFVEIYNGNVYDLLDDAETHSPLRLAVSTEGRTYICGLQKVHAITALEACQILIAGQSKMISRSHTIFTMELLRYQKDHATDEVVLSTLTFCDLAGSVQFEKSDMRKASHINNSLLVLGRCLKAVGHNQVAPFRESKLTRICQSALSGQENLSIIVNIAFTSNNLDETQNIFNFCDIVRKFLTDHYKECKRVSEFEETVGDLETYAVNITSSCNDRSSSEILEIINCDDSACKNIREENRRLKRELEIARSEMLNNEYVIRQQLADHYSCVIKKLEATYKERAKEIEIEEHDLLKWSVKRVESFYKERIDNLMRHKKRKRGDNGDYTEDNHALYEELKAENTQVTSKVMVLKEAVKKLRQENKAILCEKNKCSFELALVMEELKKFRQLMRAGIRKWGGNSENIEDNADCLMNNLEQLIDEKVKGTEKKLEEISAMENKNVEIASREKQRSLKSEDLLNDILIKMKEMEKELLRKEAYIIQLQHHAQMQGRQFAEIQQCLNDTKNEDIKNQKCKCDRSTNISFDDTINNFFQDNAFTEKSSSQMSCMSSSAVEQQELNDWITVPKLFATQNCVESIRKNDSNMFDDRKSFFENNGSMDCSVSRTSDRSSKDDSGVSSELQNESRRSISVSDNMSTHEDKCTQTCIVDEDSHIAAKDSVEQFKIDCTFSNRWNYQEMLYIAKLSRDLETIRDAIYALDETACVNECQLLYEKEALEELIEKKSEIAIKRDDLFKIIKNKIEEYKHEIRELIHKLALESLEEEVLQKTLQINKLDGKIAKMQHELAKVHGLFQKAHDFEIILNKCQKDKNKLCRQLCEYSETQLTFEDKLKELTTKITERETEIISLKNEVRNIIDLNIANKEKARNLNEQITEASENISLAKEDLHCCEDLRKNVENTIKAEIHDFTSQFSDQKNNTILLNEICKTYSDSQNEITRLKMHLEHKELEAILLKINKGTTIKKYESLMRHFQNKIEEKNKHFKTAYNANNSGRSPDNQRQPKESFKDNEVENCFINSCYVPEHVNPEILNISVSSDDSMILSKEKDGIKFDDNESYQTDGSVKSYACLHVNETDSLEMENNFNIKLPDTKDKKKILDWTKIRRISGKTFLSINT